MFGAYVRAAAAVVAAVLLGALLERIIPYLLPLMGEESSLLYRSFSAVESHAILIMLFSIVLALFARANLEGRLG